MDTRLNVGEIRYANCTPIYMSLKERADCSGYRFVEGDPAELNSMLLAGSVDVSSSSSIEYARNTDDYLIVPGVSISSIDSVASILLFSKCRVEKLGGKLISVSSASATSTVMLKALLRFRYGKEARLEPRAPELAGMLEGAEAALIIGDEALKERITLRHDCGLHVYDLGHLWHETTGLPFVYALWMIRRDSAESKPRHAARFKADILQAMLYASGNYDEIALKAPERSWMSPARLVEYWRGMSYRLDDEQIKGLMKFYEFAYKMDEAPAVYRLDFL